MSLTPSRATLSKLVSVAGTFVGIAGVAFVVKTLVARRHDVADAFSKVSVGNLVFSLLLGLAAMSSIGWIWVRMLTARGHHAPASKSMAWYFTGQLGKYVPGGIWPIVGRAEMATRGGISRSDAYSATALSMLTTYLAAIITIAFGSLAVWTYPIVGLGAVVFLGIVWLALGSNSVNNMTDTFITKVTKRPLSLPKRSRVVSLTVRHLPSWILMSLSTTVTAHAFGANISVGRMFFITSTSWLAGFVVVGVPGGIGVRESIFTALAGQVIGQPLAVSLALMSRVVFIAVDLIGAGISSLVSAISRKSHTPTQVD